jgi:hypothetical protein
MMFTFSFLTARLSLSKPGSVIINTWIILRQSQGDRQYH